MNISIKKFLLINLLATFIIATVVSVAANYFADKRDIEEYMDESLVVYAQWYRGLLADNYTASHLAKVQQHLNEVPKNLTLYVEKEIADPVITKFADETPFQIWSPDNKLLLHSPHAPATSLLGDKEGFSDKSIENHTWRVFTVYLPNGIKMAVANKDTSRNSLIAQLTIDDFYIMLFILPLSGLLIWLIIGKSLKSINQITQQLADRAPTNLEPVNVQKVPTEIKPVIDELNELFIRLKQAFEREKRFAADAAHELRTPLAILKTQAQVALKTQDSQERNDALRNLIQGVHRSAHVVQQLLTLSRLVPEATPLTEYEEVKLVKLSAEIIAQIAPMAIEKEIDIALDYDDEQITIHGNPTALSILIRNLIDNAVRYTPDGGQVNVYISSNNHQAILTVSDTGPGIPLEFRSRVFERFFRVLGNKSPGSGLGLAIVQQIAKLHNASVQLSNPPEGSGLIVKIVFPKRQEKK